MSKLYSKSGNLLHNQNDILNETKSHYEMLYSERESSDIDLNNIINSNNIKKLTEQEKETLEKELSYDEMLFSLKKMKNNTSPGSSGFTTSFYKFFWKNTGHLLVMKPL